MQHLNFVENFQDPGGDGGLAAIFDVEDRADEALIVEEDAVEVGEIELVGGGVGGESGGLNDLF